MNLDRLEKKLDACMIRDRHRFRTRLRRLRRKKGRTAASDDKAEKKTRTPAEDDANRKGGHSRQHADDWGELDRLAEQIDASVKRRSRRADSVPRIDYPPDLPVVEQRSVIADAIRDNQVVVVCGETGSGKTTQLPKICLELGRGVAGMIGHTQPRRIAAHAVASRIAEELRLAPGSEVGSKTRFRDTTNEGTLIKVMTDGILLAETPRDRFLDQYDTIIIDEAHERSLNIDFLLGYIRRLLPRRPDLKIIITSATIDPERFSKHFADAPIVEVSGRTYPVEVRYRPLVTDDPESADLNKLDGIAAAVDEVLGETAGDVLIFESGEREIRETSKMLRGRLGEGVEILPLYARLPPKEQQMIFSQRHRRRIVVATNVAETSLTVPGIAAVIDPGEARISRYSARSRVQRLPVEPISQASADQRKGRCGRIGPGLCIRMYSEADYAQRDAFTQPEIQRTNLASVVLQMKSLRLGTIESFPFVDPPKQVMIRDGLHTLHELGAIDASEELTDIGRALARLPVDPRIGRMLIAAHEEGCLTEVLVISAALSIQDPRLRPPDAQDRADETHAKIANGPSDFLALHALWRWLHEKKAQSSWNAFRRLCQHTYLSFTTVREWLDVHRQLRDLAQEAKLRMNRQPAEADDVHRALLTGLLGNVGRRGEGYEYEGARNIRFHLHPGSVLFEDKPKWVMAAELVETTRLYARNNAPIQPQWIEPIAGHLVNRSYSEPQWDAESARVTAFEKVSLYGIEIVARRRVDYGPIDPKLAREMFILHGLVEGEYETNAPFFRHNRELIEDIERIEARRRKRDVLVDAQTRYRFYDERVPADVYSGSTFKRWRKCAERDNPRLLFMSRDDLLREDAGSAGAEAYPDHVDIDGLRLPLTYHYEPGHPEDGVTVTVPQALATKLSADRLGWLVPGMLRERIIELIRTLPKSLRTHFVPAPEFADAVLDTLHGVTSPSGPLHRHVGEELSRMTGVEVPEDAWRLEDLPEHLRMNVRVVDDNGETVQMGRDLDAILRTLAGESESVNSGRLASADIATSIEREGLTQWTVGTIPKIVDVCVSGMSAVGYPALVDEGASAALRVYTRQAEADLRHRGGVRRLLAIRFGDELEHHVDHLPEIEQITRHGLSLRAEYGTVVSGFRRDLADLIVDRACLGEDPMPRDRDGFDRAFERGRSDLWSVALEQSRLVAELLARHHRIALTLESDPPVSWGDAVADIRRQVAGLLPARFLLAHEYGWLVHVPRYLQGIEVRLDRLRDGGVARDRQAMERVGRWQQCFDERQAAIRQRGMIDPMLTYFGWVLEEYRISCFAQSAVATALPVSERRLEELWRQVVT